MTEPYGRTDMLYCGCTVDADGYIATVCDQHGGLYLPPASEDDKEPDEGGYCISDCPDDICRNSGHCAWPASGPDDPVTVNARQRAAELFAASDDPDWLGI